MLQCNPVTSPLRDQRHHHTISPRRVVRACALAVLVLLAPLALPAGAEEAALPIGRILDDPNEYHLTAVILEGTVSDVHALEPYYTPSGAACYGAYTFALNDGTGSLTIDVLGFCGTPVFRPPPIVAGDRVVVDAHIRLPGHQGYFKGLIGVPLPEQDMTKVRGIADVIRQASAPRPDLLHPSGEDAS